MSPKAKHKSFHYNARTSWTTGWRGDITAMHKPNIATGSARSVDDGINAAETVEAALLIRLNTAARRSLG